MKRNFTLRSLSSTNIFLRMGKCSAKLMIALLLPVLLLGFSKTALAQPTVLGTEIVNGGYITYDLTTVGGFRQYRVQALNNAVSGSLKWEFAEGTAAATSYSTNWRPYSGGQTLSGYNAFIDPATAAASARYNSGFGGSGGLLPAVTAGNYYTFNITTNALSNNNMAVLETNYNPETITTVTQSPATVGAVVSPTVTITTSVAPQANIYVRYSVDNFVTSTIVLASFVGTTGTASIPAQAAGQTVKYYVYSSPRTKAAIDADVTTYGQSVHDMATLNLNNNAGANYSYTVLPVTINATNSVNDASYSTLTAAFVAINTGVHTGTINVWIGGNTTETVSAVLNASGGSASYASVTVKPSGLKTVTGNIAGPLVDLNGADNVTIDGLNDGTNTLTFTNQSNSAVAGTSTIRFYNGTLINTVQNCTIEGATLSTTDGIVTLGAGVNTTVSISNNNIRPAGANLSIYGVYSSGTNTSITVSNNNIQDYFSAASSSAGVYANTLCNAWTISNNKFFQTGARTVNTAGVVVRAIYVSAGGGHTISGNTIGYATSAGTGTTTYTTTQSDNKITPIELAGNATASSIQGNVIAGIAVTSASNLTNLNLPGVFTGIYVSSGAANIGTVTGNSIGAATGTGSITVTCSVTATLLYVSGITVTAASPNIVNIQNNSVGSINLVAASATVQFQFYGICVPPGATANFTIADNQAGSTSTANSIVVGASSTGAVIFGGIACATTGTASITGNIIQNISVAGTGLSTFSGIGVGNSTGVLSITNNSIISCTHSGTGSFVAIGSSSAVSTLNISGNIIRSHVVVSGTTIFTGIFNTGAVTSAININNNQLGNASGGLVTFSVSSSASFSGINNAGGTGAATLTIQSNDFRGIVNSVIGSGPHTYINNIANTISQNISSNTFTALTSNSNGDTYFIRNSTTLGATGSKIINDNSIITSFTKTGSGGSLYFYYDAGVSVAGASVTNDGNNFSNVTVNGNTSINGWFNTDGSGTVPTKNITNNTFNNLVGNTSSAYGVYITNGSGNISNNTITSCSTPNFMVGLSVNSGSFNIFSNTINTLSSSLASVTGISVSGGATHNIYSHTIHTLSSAAATATVSAVSISGGTLASVYKNKIHSLSNSAVLTSGGVYGISVTGGTTLYLNNNLVGNLTAPAANMDDAIRGMNINGGSTVYTYNNTVYLNASSSGVNFGSTALFANTVSSVELRNNILYNISIPGTNGRTVAYKRSTTSLANYQSASNNNLLYAGVPGAARLIFYDGTNSDQTLASYQTRVSARDNASVSALLGFLSTTGSSLQFLHLSGSNGASDAGVITAGIVDDYDDEVRSPTPDIGADEFVSTPCPATPTITSLSAGPYYAGDVVTITGTNLSGITYATINDINVTIGTTTAATAQLTIPVTMTDTVAVIQVAASSSCPFSNTFNFVFAGFITKGAGTGTGTWSTATIWRNNALPVNNAPAIINNGDAVTLNVSADPIKFTVNNTASFTHASSNSNVFGSTYLNNSIINGTLVIDNGSTLTSSNRFISPVLVITSTGTFTNNSANAAAVNIANFYVNPGGTYNHNAVGSTPAGVLTDFPGSSSRTFGNTSNVVITKWAGTLAPGTGLPASGSPGWGNLTINVASLIGSWNQTGNLTNVQGNLIIQSTGGGANEFRLTGAAVNNTAIAGNLVVSGGILTGANGAGNSTITVTGNVTISGGTFKGSASTGTHLLTVNGAGGMTVSGGVYTAGTSTGTATTNVTNALTVSGGVLTAPGASHVHIYSVGSIAVTSGSIGLSSNNTSSQTITSTGNISVSGNGFITSTSAGPVTINCGGDFSVNTSAVTGFAFQNASVAGKIYNLNIGGNFSVTGTGLFIGGSTTSAATINFTGGAAAVTYAGNPALMAVTAPASVKNDFIISAGKTVSLGNSIIPASTSVFNAWTVTVNTGATLDCGASSEIGGANTRTVFTLQTGATLRTAHTGGVFNTTALAASITTIATNASLSSGATYEFNGTAAQVTSAFTTTPVAATVANLVINNAAGVTLSAAYDVTAALQLQNGNLTLNNFNLTTASITGSPFSATKMVVTNGTGALGQPVSISTVLYPVGNGGQYTPVSYTFTANSTPRYLNVRAVTPRNANDFSATNYINNRWWNTSLSVATGTYSYTSVYTYISGDMVGAAASIRLNRWNGSAWVNDPASVVNNTNFTITSGTLNETTGTLAATAEWVGRVYVAPALYHWVNAAGGSWLTSTNWSPTGVPASGDGVFFDIIGGATYPVTNMPAGISLTQLLVLNNNIVNLQAGSAGSITMLFPGTATPQLSIAAGSAVTIGGSNAVTINLPANASGLISGSLNLQKNTHKLIVTTAGALVVPSGGYFSYGGIFPNNGFSGNPFGSTGTNGAVIFQSGSVCECFEGSNPFGAAVTDKITTFQANSLFRYSDPGVSLPSVSGRTYSNFTYNANKVVNASAANSFICDSLTVTTGTFNLNLQGTPTPDHSIRGNINVASGATLSFTPASAGTVNLNSGTTQAIWGAGTFNVNSLSTFDINAGTTASLFKNMGVNGTGNVVLNGTLICNGENFINTPVTAGGTVTMNSGSTLSVQSVDGIENTTAGNIRSTNFTYNGGNFIYSGAANQNTGTRLPNTITGTGVLTIANTGTNPADIVTLLPNNKTVTTLNLNSGRFNAGTAGELVIQAGTLNGNGGNQYLNPVSTAVDNIIRFNGNGVINGAPELYNIFAGGGNVDFVNNARINNIFKLNLLGAVVNHSPVYAVGSTLIYNNTGSYNRDFEWGSNTPLTPSYPHHVLIQNGTTVFFTGSTPVAMGCGGNLTIGSATGAGTGTLDMSAVGSKNLYIGGNLVIGGNAGMSNLIMSNAVPGGDIYLTGSWIRNAFGVVNFGAGNGRAVFFEGATDATITANNGQTFPYVYINKTAKATKVTLADNVNITDEIGFARGTVDLGTNNKFLTIVSTALKTGRIGPSDPVNTDFVYGATDKLGQFIIQRYMPAKRSWRLMTAPLKVGAGSHTISEAWQERGAPLAALDYSTAAATTTSLAADSVGTDFSTQITGGTIANGFDQSPTNNPSIKFYNAGVWAGPANVNATNIYSQEGWMLFARGDRKNYGQITTQLKTPLNTTLRPRGQVLIGSKSVTSTGLTVVGNPYASAVDYFTATKTGAGLAGTPTYYMWDPNMGGSFGTGAFVALTWNGVSFTRSAPLTGTGTSTIDDRYIPSGAAIMVDFGAGGTLTFNESDKNAANTTTAFRPVGQLQAGLYSYDSDGSSFVADGALSLFNKLYSNDVDREDALKPSNFSENFGIKTGAAVLSVERRKPVSEHDTIFYKIANMKQRNYRFELVMNDVPTPPGTGAFLEDSYLHNSTPVSLNGNTAVDFSITADAASAGKERFRLVFKPTVVFGHVSALLVKNDVNINWQLLTQINMDRYEIERSTDGNSFTTIGQVAYSEQVQAFDYLDRSPAAGVYFYRIKAVSKHAVTKYSETVKVIVVKDGSGLYVYPNPVEGNIIQLQFAKPAGSYQSRLLTSNGQVILNRTINHAGGVSTYSINIQKQIAPGIYNLEVTDMDGRTVLIKVFIN